MIYIYWPLCAISSLILEDISSLEFQESWEFLSLFFQKARRHFVFRSLSACRHFVCWVSRKIFFPNWFWLIVLEHVEILNMFQNNSGLLFLSTRRHFVDKSLLFTISVAAFLSQRWHFVTSLFITSPDRVSHVGFGWCAISAASISLFCAISAASKINACLITILSYKKILILWLNSNCKVRGRQNR
jgi:hypothetical protein